VTAAPLEELYAERRFELGICAHSEGCETLRPRSVWLIAASHVVAVKFAICRPIVTALYGSSYWKEIVNFGVDTRTDAAQSPAPSSLAPRRPAARGIPLTS
jgi:hypothetical protein